MVTCGICSVNIHIRCASLPQKICKYYILLDFQLLSYSKASSLTLVREKSYSCPRCKFTSEANKYEPQCFICPTSEKSLFLEWDFHHLTVIRAPPSSRDWCHIFCKHSDNISFDGVDHAKCYICGRDKGVVCQFCALTS
jgi:hypothetical protein